MISLINLIKKIKNVEKILKNMYFLIKLMNFLLIFSIILIIFCILNYFDNFNILHYLYLILDARTNILKNIFCFLF